MSRKITVQVIHFVDTTEEALERHQAEPHMPLAGTNRYVYETVGTKPKDTIQRKETNSNASKQRTAKRPGEAKQDDEKADEFVGADAIGREGDAADQQTGRDGQSDQPDQSSH